MKQKWIVAGLVTVAALIVIGTNFAAQRREKEADAASLRAQRSFGQQTRPAMPSGGPMAGSPMQELNLTESQKASMQQLMQEAPRPDPNDTPEQMRSKMEAHFAKMEQILTPEQRAKMPKMPAGMPMMPPVGGQGK